MEDRIVRIRIELDAKHFCPNECRPSNMFGEEHQVNCTASSHICYAADLCTALCNYKWVSSTRISLCTSRCPDFTESQPPISPRPPTAARQAKAQTAYHLATCVLRTVQAILIIRPLRYDLSTAIINTGLVLEVWKLVTAPNDRGTNGAPQLTW